MCSHTFTLFWSWKTSVILKTFQLSFHVFCMPFIRKSLQFHLYCVFTCIYSLLIEKDICDCQNISIKLPCVYLCLSSGELFIFSVRFPLYSYFCVIILFAVHQWGLPSFYSYFLAINKQSSWKQQHWDKWKLVVKSISQGLAYPLDLAINVKKENLERWRLKIG